MFIRVQNCFVRHLQVHTLALLALLGLASYNRAAASEETQSPSILILGRTFYGGQKNVDSEVKARLNKQGYQIGLGLYRDLTWDVLKRFNGVVLLAQPLPGTAEYKDFQRCEPLLGHFLNEGGGIFVLRDQTSGGAGDTQVLNEFLKPFGAEMREINYVSDSLEVNTYWWDFQLKAFKTNDIAAGHPVTEGVKEFWYPGHTVALSTDSNWTVLVKGSGSSQAKDKTSAPIIMAARQAGKGRLLVFPSPSTYTVLEGFSNKWAGKIFEMGDGWKLFENAFHWLCESNAGGQLGGFIEKDQSRIFDLERLKEYDHIRYVPIADQGKYGALFKCLIGYVANKEQLGDIKKTAKGRGYSVVVVITSDATALHELDSTCQQISEKDFLIAPGLEVTDDKGNRGLVIGGALLTTDWPPPEWKKPSLRAANIACGSMTVWLTDRENPTPPTILGGISSIEIKGYDANGNAIADGEDLYLKLNRYDWFTTPVSVSRLNSIDSLSRFTGYDTYVQAPSLDLIREGLVHGSNVGAVKVERFKPFSQRLFPAFVSNGPKINQFYWRGPGLVCDLWEGEYYLWSSSEERAEIVLDIESRSEIKSVKIIESGRVIRNYQPNEKTFKKVFFKKCDNASQNYMVIVEDRDGKRAISSTLRSRTLNFFAHGGADRMQTYANLFVKDPNGKTRIGDEKYAFISTTYFDLGWGNVLEKAIPPIRSQLFSVNGLETGGPRGGLSKYIYPPFLGFAVQEQGGRVGFTMANIERYGYELAGRDCAILKDHALRSVVRSNAGKMELKPSTAYDIATTYTIYRFREDSFEAVLMETEFTKKNGEWQEGWIPYFNLDFKKGSKQILKEALWFDDQGIHKKPIDFNTRKVEESLCTLTTNQFAALGDDGQCGNAGLFVLDKNKYRMSVDPDRPGLVFQVQVSPNTGNRIKTRTLLIYTSSREKDLSEYLTSIRQYIETLNHSVTILKGTSYSENYPRIAAASESGVILKASGKPGLQYLPLQINDLNLNCSIGRFDLVKKQGELISGYQGALYTIHSSDDADDYFYGNLVSCDQKDIIVDVIDMNQSQWSVIVHNPTPVEKKVKIRCILSEQETVITLKPGEETTVRL